MPGIYQLLPSQVANPSITNSPSTFGHTYAIRTVGVDLFSHLGSTYLVFVDHWSGCPVGEKLSSVSTASVVKCLKHWFYLLGWPKSIRSDDGPQFTNIFNVFCRENNIICLLYTSPSPRDRQKSRMPSSA